MTRSAYTFALTLTAVSLCLAAPATATAQLYLENYRSDKPGIELDMDVLNDLPPRAPGHQAAPQNTQPQPEAGQLPQNAPAAPAPQVETAPRKLNQPLFAAPIPTPMPQQAQPVPQPQYQLPPRPAEPAPQVQQQPAPSSILPPRVMSMPPKPAARKPYNPYLTAPAPATPAVQKPAPVVRTPQPALPPARPVPMPVTSDLNTILHQSPNLPHRKPDVAPVTDTAFATPVAAPQNPLPKPPIESLPDEVISAAEMDNLPDTDTLAVAEKTAPPIANDTQTPASLPAPKPVFTRPSLIVTDKKPPTVPRAVLKQAEVTMPISATEYEQIAENMERVPVQVAMAPPKPVLSPKPVSAADLTLEFDRTSENLNAAAQEKLKNIVAHMKTDAEAKLQVRAYATGEDGSKSAARSKSLTRATEVRSFLMDNGIKPTRVIVRALGQETDRKPLDRIDLTFTK